MNTQKIDTRRLTKLSMLLALEIILVLTDLGMIPIPPISITIAHIPVIIGAILMGYKAGAFLGGAFGVLSMIRAAMYGVNLGDIIFNPFASKNPLGSIVMAVLPRVLLGLVAAGVYQLLSGKVKNQNVRLVAAIVPACLVHSLGVLGLMSVLFNALPLKAVFGAIIGVNGLIELGVAVVVGTAICRVLLKLEQKHG